MRVTITLVDILKYIGDGRRPLREGEALMLSGHIVKCGIKDKTCIYAYVIQSSAIQKDPHVVTIHLHEDPFNWVCTCSCKAGMGSRCKHIVGVLLYINRNDVEEVTCTDLAQQWGKDSAKGTQAEYKKPVRIKEYCHVTMTKSKFKVSKDVQQQNLSAFLKCKPNSALAKFFNGRTAAETLPKRKSDNSETVGVTHASSPSAMEISGTVLKDVSANIYGNCTKNAADATLFPAADKKYISAEAIFSSVAKENSIVLSLENSMPGVATEMYRKNILKSKIDCVQIYNNTRGQNNSLWKEHRKYRITGSTCYKLYTYANNKSPDWKKKVDNFINPNFFGNENTFYGQQQEESARKCYEQYVKQSILQCGLVIHPRHPWLACSPDGVTCNLEYLIEIKCPVIGRNMTAANFVNKLPYIDFKNNVYSLKKKHIYYGQIQLGMFILNIKKCHFVIYASYDETCIILEELYDEAFVQQMLSKLQETYFVNMLPLF